MTTPIKTLAAATLAVSFALALSVTPTQAQVIRHPLRQIPPRERRALRLDSQAAPAYAHGRRRAADRLGRRAARLDRHVGLLRRR